MEADEALKLVNATEDHSLSIFRLISPQSTEEMNVGLS